MIVQFTSGRPSNVGASLEVVDVGSLKGDCFQVETIDPASRHGWLRETFLYFLHEHELSLDIADQIWIEVYDVLRCDFGRLPISAWYGQTAVELAETFLHFLAHQPTEPILLLETGLFHPYLVGYLLDTSILSETISEDMPDVDL